MVFVLSPCSRGTSRAQLVAFANGSVYPVPPVVVEVDPLPEKSSGMNLELIHLKSGLGELTLICHSSDETVGRMVSKIYLDCHEATHNSVLLVL